MVRQGRVWFIQILCIILLRIWECVEDALQPRVLILTHDDESINIIFAIKLPPICAKLVRVDNDLDHKG